MTKRWERELRRLDDVDAPTERIRAHAADRPTDPQRGEGLPPRRQRITAGVVAVVVFVAAGTFAWQAFRPSGEKGDVVQPGPGTTAEIALVANHEDGPSRPTASLDVAGVSVPGVLTSYSWSDGNSTLNADTVAPSFGPSDYTPVALPAALEVTGDASAAEVAVQAPGEFPFTTIEDLGAVTAAVPIDQGPGRYVLQVMAHWPQGDVPFYFPIELVPQVVNTATLTFTARDAPEARLTYADAVSSDVQAGVRGEYQWCDGKDACEGGIPEFPTYPPVSIFMEVPAGTSLMLESSVQAIKGGFLTMDGEKASPTFEDPVHFGSIPTEPGKYALEVHVTLDGDNGAHGSATFWFGVEVVPTAPPTASPVPAASASPVGEVSDVLRISCGGDGTQVFTPVVAAGPDGVDVELLDADIGGAVARPTGLLRMEWYLQEGVTPVQLPVGEVALQCGEGTSYRSADFVPEAMATIVDPGSSFVRFALDCPIDKQVRLRTPGISPDGDRSDAPSAVEAVTKRLEGILPTDVVETAGYPEGDWPWPWVRIVRDGRIVAWAGVDGREGWRYRLNHATSCAGTEIGTPETSQDSFIGFG